MFSFIFCSCFYLHFYIDYLIGGKVWEYEVKVFFLKFLFNLKIFFLDDNRFEIVYEINEYIEYFNY